MDDRLLKFGEVDIIFRFPTGRTKRLARQGIIPVVKLPDGSSRIRESIVEQFITGQPDFSGFAEGRAG